MNDATEELIAYVYGDDVPPDFETLAACGFNIVCLDKTAPWYNESMIAEARKLDLTVVAFAMKHVMARLSGPREFRKLPQKAS
jgi:hypothetical protein